MINIEVLARKDFLSVFFPVIHNLTAQWGIGILIRMLRGANRLPHVGGQAVIEGVMMRSGSRIATAVRRANGEVTTRVSESIPWSKRNKLFGIPVIRGTLGLIEMLSVGISSLNWSAGIAEADIRKKEGKPVKASSTWPAMFIGLVIGIGFFVLIPLFIARLFGLEKEALSFNLVAGLARVIIFTAYILAISLFPDVKRLFRYHGAEHKSIYTFENGELLTVENARKYTTLHPRCGTSFILIVAVVSIVFFAIADSIIAAVFGLIPPILARFGIHLLLWPILVGICYETLKISALLSEKYRWARFLVWPGLAMQRVSTAEPSDDMLEVAIAALKEAVGPVTASEILKLDEKNRC